MTRSKIFIIAIILCLSRPLLAIAGDRDDGSPDSKSSGPIAENDRNKLIEFIAGTVQTPDGKPAAGAHVVIIGTQWRGDHVTSTAYPIELIALETCDQNGSFRMDHLKPSHGRWSGSTDRCGPGYGLVWRRIDLYEAVRNPIRITLPIAHTMRGRLNTADGHPAAGVAVEVMSIGQTRDTDKLLLSIGSSRRNLSDSSGDRRKWRVPHRQTSAGHRGSVLRRPSTICSNKMVLDV